MASPLYSQIEPQTRELIQKLIDLKVPPINELPVEEARQVLLRDQLAVPVSKLPAELEERRLPGGKLGEISVRVIRPKGLGGKLPVVMYFHGGGWALGDADTHDRLVREIAHGAEAAVVFVNYTRSPEARYPTAIEQAYAATEWVAARGQEWGLDGARLAVAGDSAGGNMAAVVALLAKERGPKIAFQALLYPVMDAGFDTESYRKFATGYVLTLEAMKWFWGLYAPDASLRLQPSASPLRSPLEKLQGLPPALITTAEFDVLRDEGEAYAHRLIEAGVPVTATRYLGAIHDFVLLNILATTPPTRAAITQAGHVLRDALSLTKRIPSSTT